MKKFLLLVLSAILACFCCACGNNDDAQKEKEEDNHKSPVPSVLIDSNCITLYSSSGKVYYNNDKRVDEYRYDRENISIPQGGTYYLCITIWSGLLSFDTGEKTYGQYINPAVFDDDGELVSEPSIEYDSEYIEVVSKSNWSQCMYMIKALNSTEKTTITVPKHIADGGIFSEISLSFSIE